MDQSVLAAPTKLAESFTCHLSTPCLIQSTWSTVPLSRPMLYTPVTLSNLSTATSVSTVTPTTILTTQWPPAQLLSRAHQRLLQTLLLATPSSPPSSPLFKLLA